MIVLQVLMAVAAAILVPTVIHFVVTRVVRR